jgi:hypothetical protein
MEYKMNKFMEERALREHIRGELRRAQLGNFLFSLPKVGEIEKLSGKQTPAGEYRSLVFFCVLSFYEEKTGSPPKHIHSSRKESTLNFWLRGEVMDSRNIM